MSQAPETKEREITVEVVELAPNGLGFGEGSISTQAQLANPEVSNLTPEAMRVGAEIIKSGEAFVEVEESDDGCGDGRPAGVIYQVDAQNGERQEYNASHNRAKVFGGGLVVASSMYRTVIGGSVGESDTVLGDRLMMAGKLKEAGINYGGHTDNHAHGELCGCGAIDKYPVITQNALTYREDILNTLRVVYGEEFESRLPAINEVFASYEEQVGSDGYFSDAQGVKTQKLMEDDGAVIKQLSDAHLEDFLVVNAVEGTTFDQRKFDQEMITRGVEGTAQVFVVDAWRGRMYADFIADMAEEAGLDRELALQKADADFWIRTLAVSATLTAGDQPAFLRTA